LIENKPKRRDKLIIMMDIIGIARKPTSKTHIMFKANLSFSQLNEYIGFLLQHNLLEKVVCDGKIFFKATKKGQEYINLQQQVIFMFEKNSPIKSPRFTNNCFILQNNNSIASKIQ
jgi:predicted transcriptional regulator